jgi:N-methylhydantoinase B
MSSKDHVPDPTAYTTKTDPATFEVVKNSLYAAAEEMRVVMAKTAYSPLLKVAGDYSCGIFDIDGAMVAQGPDLPVHLGSMPDAVSAVVRAFTEHRDGDVYIHNDPYQGGTHLPDINVVTPILFEDTVLGFGCVRAHWPDVGSATPGSYGAVTEIYGEGLRLPPIQLYEGGVLNEAVDAVIFANVRTPDERRGDLRAQMAANRRACQRLAQLAGKYGPDTLLGIMQEVMDYSETMMRVLLRQMPDGEAVFEDFCDGDGIIEDGADEDEPIPVRLKAIKRGDTLTVDFAGSADQVAGPMNAPLPVTASGIYTTVKMVVDPNNMIPPNSGCWRPVTLLAPKGCVFNAQWPAPVVYANHEMSHRAADMLFGALAQIVPDRVMACSQGTSGIFTVGGIDPQTDETYISYDSVKGGFGARPNKDGINSVASGIGNMMNTPIEILEMSFPLRVDRYEVIEDSGGAGKFRGGCGTRRIFRVLGHAGRAAVCCERTKSAPFGLFGGLAGAPGQITLVAGGNPRVLNSKGAFTVPPDGQVVFDSPGSGGYGSPAERDPEALRDDMINGYVTVDMARRDYGIDDPAAFMAEKTKTPK